MAREEKQAPSGSAKQTNKSSVEGLKRKLYARNEKGETGERRTPLVPNPSETPTSWPKEELQGASATGPVSGDTVPTGSTAPPLADSVKKPRMPFAAKFLLGSMGFFVIAMGLAAYVFFGGANVTSPQNIDLEVVVPSLVDGGSEVQFEIIVRNRNTTALELVDLVITYPPGTRNPTNPSQDLTHERQPIGTIASGEVVKRSAQALVYGGEGEAQTVNVVLEYSVAGSNAVFTREAQAQFTIGSAPVSLSVSAPKETVSGQAFPLTLVVRSNSEVPITNVVVKGEYPFGFSLLESSIAPDAGGLWRLGTLQPGSSRTITLTGSIQGQDGDERVFRFIAGSTQDPTNPKVEVPFITIPQTLTIHRPFIAGNVAIEGRTGTVAVNAGTTLQGTVSWQNNLPDAISDLELTLNFEGPALDPNSIQSSNGFFRSSDTSLVWSKNEAGELASIPPGGSGSFSYSFRTRGAGESGTLITNPTIYLVLSVRAVREAGAPEIITSVAEARATVASALSLTTEVLHFSGPFTNAGPMPPRAESPTSYTVQWTITNSSNAVGNGLVSATLPPYVRFVSGQSGITYNEGSRTVTWTIGDIKAGTGYTSSPLSAAFQVEITPSTSQVGQSPQLTTPPVFTGQDRFAQVPLGAQGQAATTRLVGDTQTGMDVVAPK